MVIVLYLAFAFSQWDLYCSIHKQESDLVFLLRGSPRYLISAALFSCLLFCFSPCGLQSIWWFPWVHRGKGTYIRGSCTSFLVSLGRIDSWAWQHVGRWILCFHVIWMLKWSRQRNAGVDKMDVAAPHKYVKLSNCDTLGVCTVELYLFYALCA